MLLRLRAENRGSSRIFFDKESSEGSEGTETDPLAASL